MNKPRGLHGWIRLLEGNQAASLAGLLRELDNVTASDDTSGQQLCDLILKDASLTSHIIRIGNSIQFNPSTIPVTTVSRAVINIGFKHIRSVCLTVKVLESLLDDEGSDLLFSRLAACLHSAHQSRMLCEKFSASEREEAFVASLLSNLTELLVLSSNKPEAKELARRLDGGSSSKERNRAAEEVLGVSFRLLSKTLLKRWRIDGLVNQIYEPGALDARLQTISLGEDIALATLEGWNSHSFKLVLKRSVSLLGKPGVDVKLGMQRAADATALALQAFGNKRLNSFIPSGTLKSSGNSVEPDLAPTDIDVNSVATHSQNDGIVDQKVEDKAVQTQSETGLESVLLQPSAEFQLESLQTISEMMIGTLQINAFMEALLAGLNKGVGLERCAFLLFERGHRRLVTKFAVGERVADWPGKMAFTVSDPEQGFVADLFKGDVVANIAQEVGPAKTQEQELNSIKSSVGTKSFLLAPLTANGKKLGLLYADMALSNRVIDGKYVIGFQQFYLQTKLALGMIANQQKK